MSTIKKQRAKKVILLLLGVSSVATLGLLASFDQADQPQEDANLEPDKNLDSVVKAIDVDAAVEAVKEQSDSSKAEENNFSQSAPKFEIMIPNLTEYEKVNVIATGYTAGVESTGKDPSHPEYGITYSGVYVRRDIYSTIAADPSVFPLGTVLYIPGYGYGVVADTGSAIKGKIIDLYFETVEDVYNEWGKKHVDVYVIKRGEGSLSENTLDQYNRVAMVNTNKM